MEFPFGCRLELMLKSDQLTPDHDLNLHFSNPKTSHKKDPDFRICPYFSQYAPTKVCSHFQKSPLIPNKPVFLKYPHFLKSFTAQHNLTPKRTHITRTHIHVSFE